MNRPSFTESARSQWIALPESQFEAVYQVRASLDDVYESHDWRHVHVLTTTKSAGVEIKLVENFGVFFLVDVALLQVFAIGQPGL